MTNVSGYKIRALRLKHKMKSEICAHYLEITPTYLSLVENGKKHPSDKVIDKAVRLFNVPSTYFLSLSEPVAKIVALSADLSEEDKNIISSILGNRKRQRH
ncbi:helix-turn-helix domain-containing protein [Photobacterium jeanii]|nr:helix-turn-helix transcriptional regulator [Photobacterium jeanii]